jgi:hypothetical protein
MGETMLKKHVEKQQIITANVTPHIKKSREGVQMQVGLAGKGHQL